MAKAKNPVIFEKKLSRRDFIKTTAAAAVVSAGSLGIPTLLRAQPKEIPIGHIHPLSGPLAFDGQELQNGLMLAVKEINAAGGIKSMGGAKLKVLSADSEGKPELAIKEMERLAGDGAVAVLGCYQSAVTVVATQTAEKLKVPFVVSVAVADEKHPEWARPLLDMLVDAGIDGLNPLERRAGMAIEVMRRRYPRLVLTGGMCNTDTLLNGPRQRIRDEARSILDLGRDGGIVIGTHSISPEVPPDHFAAYLDECNR